MSLSQPGPHNHLDPTAIDDATEAAFDATGRAWFAAYDAACTYLEAAGRAARLAGADAFEQLDAIDVATRNIIDVIGSARFTAAQTVGGDR